MVESEFQPLTLGKSGIGADRMSRPRAYFSWNTTLPDFLANFTTTDG